MRVAIHQPNYAPWCGYFAKMNHCDVFVFLDNVQMPGGQSYVYRTPIRGGAEAKWLSIPTRYHLGDNIDEVRFAVADWPRKHEGALRGAYARSPYFREVWELIEPVYSNPGANLAEFNMKLIRTIAGYLGLACRFEASSTVQPDGQGDDRLISLVRKVGGDVYISGKGGQNYQDPAKFAEAGIELRVHTYSPVPYRQAQGEFVAGLSILDALFNLGPEAASLLVYEGAQPLVSTNP